MYQTNKRSSSFKIPRGLSLRRLGSSFLSTSSRSFSSERPSQEDDSLKQHVRVSREQDTKVVLLHQQDDLLKKDLPSVVSSTRIHQNGKNRFSRRARMEQLNAFEDFLDRQPKEEAVPEKRKKVMARAA